MRESSLVVGRSKYRYRDLARPGTALCARTGTVGVQKGRESSTDMLRPRSIFSTLMYTLYSRIESVLRKGENSETRFAFSARDVFGGRAVPAVLAVL
jgi:hypothetical protein